MLGELLFSPDLLEVEKHRSFYYLKPFIHHGGAIDRNFGTHRPIRMPNGLSWRDSAKFT